MKILFLVLFFLFTSLSCKQNPRNMLSSPPKIEEEITNNNTVSSNTNSGGNIDNDLNSGYGYYDVSVLENGTSVQTVKYRISYTDKLLEAYSNMILNTDKTPKFELSKNNNTETYTFASNLDLKNKTTTKIAKKFRGVCIVRIYPDATTKTANSSLLGNYTIAGVYTEIEGNTAAGNGISRAAMTKSDKFSNTGYDELIVLRYDETVTDATSSSQFQRLNYRADILFNDDEGIDLYDYKPDRIFKNQNTNYSFVNVKATP